MPLNLSDDDLRELAELLRVAPMARDRREAAAILEAVADAVEAECYDHPVGRGWRNLTYTVGRYKLVPVGLLEEDPCSI